MAITLEQVKKLRFGSIIYQVNEFNKTDGSNRRWKVNGKLKTWKTRPNEFKLPVKHGFYSFGYITHENAHLFTIDSTGLKL